MKKRTVLSLLLLTCLLLLAGCQDQSEPEGLVAPEAQETREVEIEGTAFDGARGCAVLYAPQDHTYAYYNKEMAQERVSPYSTFKIISTLMGLHDGVLTGPSSTMHYSGATYSHPEWNRELTLQEAFPSSCVWYFRQVMDVVGRESAEVQLRALSYGNADCSQWQGSGKNPQADLNGFWLDSSLKISPAEQVAVLERIFSSQSLYSAEEVAVLQEIMRTEAQGPRQIYGKTGTGYGGEGWFVGFQEEHGKRVYFAVYLSDQDRGTTGADAKEVALALLEDCPF